MPRDSLSAETATALVTMGGQAQVVTFALDDLLSRGERISKLLVLHLAPHNPRVRRDLSHLSSAFAEGQYQGHPTEFRHLAVQIDDWGQQWRKGQPGLCMTTRAAPPHSVHLRRALVRCYR